MILVFTFVSLWIEALWPLVISAVVTFLFLLATARNDWTEKSVFGKANTLTAFRLLAVFYLALYGFQLNNYLILGIGLLILILDGVDGWLAKRNHETSDFGAYFDKETDAFFMLILCLLAIGKGLIWSWVVLLGLMRYLFAIFLFLYKTEVKAERRSQVGRIIYIIVVSALLSAFLPYPVIYQPAILIATVLLGYSFSRDILWILKKG
ncbi:MAG TPA: hypothetical protein ENK14_06185 [Caldithrix sp.]|nr:hypothetical protein [Caldithrix sp.]